MPVLVPCSASAILSSIFLLIYICQVFNIQGGIHPGAVVFFVTIYTVPESTYISYVVARIIDTGIGVAFSLLISRLWPSPYEVPKYSTPAVYSAEKKAITTNGDSLDMETEV